MSRGSSAESIDLIDNGTRNGDSLPIRKYTVTIAEVFMFSAITWNRHRLHYDKDQAIKEGHDGVLVQRGLIGNVLSRYIANVLMNPVIRKLHWKVLKSTLAGSTLIASGSIAGSTNTMNGELNLTLKLSNSCGEIVCQASAVVLETEYRTYSQASNSPYKN